MSSFSSNISLIDLSKQFPFEIDDDLKDELSFGETLVISCGHYEVDTDVEESSSDTSTTTKSTEKSCTSVTVVPQKDYEIKDASVKADDEEKPPSTVDSENDFHIFFFPKCDEEPKAQTSRDSIIIVDGLPKVNVEAKVDKTCLCDIDENKKCTCFAKMPCRCVDPDNPEPECKCSKLEHICLCHSKEVLPVCTCTESQVCVCHPDNKPRPTCTCGETSPCVCHLHQTYPYCICAESQSDENITESTPEKTCPCNTAEEHVTSTNMDSTSACRCAAETINETSSESHTCACGNPKDCKCFHSCQCEKPCICEYIQDKTSEHDECKCLDVKCASKKCESNKLKKVKVSKEGYRWCHDTDPHHTFFDFGYGRHDKIEFDGPVLQDKITILGLHDKEEAKELIAEKADEIPKYRKKKCGPSLDCCSVVGGISISVETLGEDKNTFLVQVVSNATKEGSKTGTKLVSMVDCNMHTLEENRIESVTKANYTKEKRSYMAICDNGYYNKITRITGERNAIKRRYHTFEEAHDFLLEGANIILMRYFGLRRYRGNVKTKTVLINGIICESIYVCQGVSQAIVNGKPLFVVKVERHIIEPSGYIHQTLTVLTLRGYIVSHEWADSCHILHLNPLLNIIPEKDEIERHEPLREHWRNDLQLLSDYLDFKGKRTSEGARYATENGPLAATIRDYLQTLLILRPSDAIQFTRSYFGTALSALDLPHNSYFDSSTKGVRYYFFEQ